MKNLVIASFIIIVLAVPSQGFCIDIPPYLQQDVEQAMKDGNALFDAYMKGPISDQDAELKRGKVSDFCDFQYKAYAVATARGIFFIAEPPSQGSIVFGRHYKVTEISVVKSSVSCLAVPPPPPNSWGTMTSHMLSDAPTDFHVFLSLKHNHPIYVATRVGTWKVEKGVIEFEK